MSFNPKTGNRLLLFALAAALALAALGVSWGNVTITAQDLETSLVVNGRPVKGAIIPFPGPFVQMVVGKEVPVDGLLGRLRGIPYWAAIASALVGLLLMALNAIKFSDVPRLIPALLLLFGGGFAFAAIGAHATSGTLGYGGFLLLAACVIGLCLTPVSNRASIPQRSGINRDTSVQVSVPE